jgi:outer membrane protein assembly factor BamC
MNRVDLRRSARASCGGLRSAVAIVAAATLIAGCSITQTVADATRIDYKSANRGPGLDVPPDLVRPRADDRFAVPERSATGTTLSAYNRERAVEPAASSSVSGVLPKTQGVRLERQGGQRWLVVDQPPDRVWPVLRDFWGESGFVLRIESPETGVMETDWAENRGTFTDSWVRSQLNRALGSLYSTGTRDKFRTRLESDGKVTEVFLTHRGLGEEPTGVQKETTIWVPRPSDPELEAEFLRRMMLRLSPEKIANASPDGGATASDARTASESPARASLVEADGRSFVQLQDGFDRSWRQVGLVLDRSGFTVEDRDRSKGTFFVRYVDPQQETRTAGMLDRVFGSGPKKDLSGKRYRITVSDDPAGSRVGVLGEDGSPPSTDADRRVATQIVGVLRDQLR